MSFVIGLVVVEKSLIPKGQGSLNSTLINGNFGVPYNVFIA